MNIALVIGSSGTLGKGLVNVFLDKNYKVFATYNNHKLDVENDNLKSYRYDLNNEQCFNKLVNDLDKLPAFKSFIIIYASGIYGKCSIEEFDNNEFIKYLNVNSLGFMNIYIKVLPFIKKSEITNIILIGTNLLKRKNKGSIYYNLSKCLQEQIVKQIAYEHGEYNVLINQISPGLFISNMNESLNQSKLNDIKNNIPLKRISSSSELAKFICGFSISNTFVTGETITMDGGNTIGY